ncbi:hypothetical protein [Opitutus sp. ER46]|uniref:tetratricopeptide repeat protein n=1 Tax=Opitutus sp. ER46 TaxID=2161864 RepID=UPI001304E43D|nr:hypothetical protein [Opitutus sp. ER46]
MTGYRKYVGWMAVLVVAGAGLAGGAEAPRPAVRASVSATPLNAPVPLAGPGATAAVSAGNAMASLAAAQRAQELGLASIAVALYEQLVALPGADRAALSLPLASALLDAGRAAEAERVLQAAPGGRGPEWRLRLGLAAAQQRNFGLAAEQVNQINVDQLTRPDRAWFWFLQAVLADTATPPDSTRANEGYNRAQAEAPTDLARATFLAAGLRVKLQLRSYTAAEVQQARDNYERLARSGLQQAYSFGETYAVMRTAAGERNEAVRFLQELLMRIPATERTHNDEVRRLLGLIGDRARGGAGRNALNQLLATGSTPDYQRQALQLLAHDSTREPERGLFRQEVDALLRAKPKSAVYDSLLLMRANLALEDNDYAVAEGRANELKDSYPGSSLRPHAFVVLATSAWEQRRYRLAADNARLAREALAESPAARSPREAPVVTQQVAQLRVLEAEARFRAGDFRLAGDTYAAAVQNPPAGIAVGELMFQRVLAAIKADQDDPKADLARIVDELVADPRFDAQNRWEAEWSLARGLKMQRRTEEALARVTALLDSPQANAAELTPELRARMTWLQSRLAFEANRPELTLQLGAKLAAATAGLPPALRTEMASTAALLKAEAEFRLDRRDDALKTLAQLRADFPESDAAIYSYLVAAAYYADRDKIQEAQTVLRDLIENPRYAQSDYVPYALFQQAILFERLGQPKDLREANDRIEALVKRDSPPAPAELVFAARLKQGDLLRTLNEFPQAQLAYEDLVNNPKYVQRPDVMVAKLRLAECHNAQSSTDPSGSHADLAQSMFEELLYRVAAPAEVRIEAGYNLGKLLERRGQFDRARDVWWRDVIKPFLVDAEPGAAMRATQPYWLARTLLDLGALLEQRELTDEARRVYVLLRDSRLGYAESIAREQLQRLGVPAAPAQP